MSSSKWLVMAAAMTLAACGSREADDRVAIDNGAVDINASMPVEAGPATTAGDFVTAVGASDLYEIEAGRIAAQKANSEELKSFADMLVADHQKSTADLKTAAGQSSPPVTVSPALDAEKQGLLDALKNAGAADFDRTFVDQQKQAHQKALDLLRRYQSSGDSQSLKDFAGKASAVVQAHLDRLNGLSL